MSSKRSLFPIIPMHPLIIIPLELLELLDLLVDEGAALEEGAAVVVGLVVGEDMLPSLLLLFIMEASLCSTAITRLFSTILRNKPPSFLFDRWEIASTVAPATQLMFS
jgi:hypothetical protein